MGITSAGMQSRDADCGGHARTRTMRQIQQNKRFIISYHLHGRLVRRTHKPKQRFNPAGSGDTKKTSCAFV
ncbi:hypothetical protein I7U92_001877 [Salmonella enterica]|nr:hypothetical protein [Salmonella enterica]EGR8106878.1 hypothetical protein [Salmonella enterica]EHM7255328.1 hypothetical protein [Salmonella enterica]